MKKNIDEKDEKKHGHIWMEIIKKSMGTYAWKKLKRSMGKYSWNIVKK